MTSYHQHNMDTKGPVLIEKLKDGKNIALVTDAECPEFRTQGRYGKRCRQEGIPVTIAPGSLGRHIRPCAFGMDARRYVFEVFCRLIKRKADCAEKS